MMKGKERAKRGKERQRVDKKGEIKSKERVMKGGGERQREDKNGAMKL